VIEMFDELQGLTYENEFIVALGPIWSALSSGFAILIGNQLYLTPAGERYLEKRVVDIPSASSSAANFLKRSGDL
jgi:hypothetical protein